MEGPARAVPSTVLHYRQKHRPHEGSIFPLNTLKIRALQVHAGVLENVSAKVLGGSECDGCWACSEIDGACTGLITFAMPRIVCCILDIMRHALRAAYIPPLSKGGRPN
eukprot:453824-Amphidinium_carterae.1